MIHISSYPEYEICINRGFNPLVDWRMFSIDIKLRIDIQHQLFGAANFQQENQKFYKWVWSHKIQACEETGKPLHNYSSVYISHIISRGSDRRIATDPRNINILCYEAHNMWENPTKNKSMNIYRVNQLVIEMIKKDYNL